jgi:nondiscriminating glutamyl-tRNA synthetase
MTVPELTTKLVPFLEKAGYKPMEWDRVWLEKLVALHQERIFMLAQFGQLAKFFFDDHIEYGEEAKAEFKKDPRLKDAFERYAAMLEGLGDFEVKTIEEKSRALMKELGLSGKEFIHPSRIAVTGRTVSPGFFDTIALLGKKKAVSRLREAAKLVG